MSGAGPHRLVDEVVERQLAGEVPYPHGPVHGAGQHLVTFRRMPIPPSHPSHVALRARHVLIRDTKRVRQATQ